MTISRIPLVIGGAGFIGSELVRQLAAVGPVRVLDDFSTGKSENVADVADVDLVEGSILDAGQVDDVISGASVVYHLACLGVRHSIWNPLDNHAVNALGTLNVLEAARRHSADRVVYVSTSEVYGTAETVPMTEDHPTSAHTVYGGSKLAGESYARAYFRTYNVPTVVIRPFNSFGPRSHHEGDSGEVIPKFILRLKNGLSPVIFGDGTQTRDFTYVEDTARGIRLAGSASGVIGETINVGSNQEISINELAVEIAQATGRPDIHSTHQAGRPGDVLRLYADSSKAASLLDWAPTVGIRDGLSKLLEWHEERQTDWNELLTEDVRQNWERTQR